MKAFVTKGQEAKMEGLYEKEKRDGLTIVKGMERD
jgi:hypothetical protein